MANENKQENELAGDQVQDETPATVNANHSAPPSVTSMLLERTRLDLLNNSNSYYNDNKHLIRQTIANTSDASGSSLVDQLDQRDNLIKMKKALKSASININAQLENDIPLSKVLENVGNYSLSQNCISGNITTTDNSNSNNNNNKSNHSLDYSNHQETTIALAYLEFSEITSQLSKLIRNYTKSLNNKAIFPLETMLKNDIKCSLTELKRPVEKSLSDYELKLAKLEKDKTKKKHKDATNNNNSNHPQYFNSPIAQSSSESFNSSIYPSDSISATDINNQDSAPASPEKEKRIFQLNLCEYLIRINEIKTRRGVDLLQHLVDHFNSQATLFRQGLQLIEQYQEYVENLGVNLSKIKSQQDDERRQLLDLRKNLKETMKNFSSSNYHYKEPWADPTILPNNDDGCLLQQVSSNIRRHSVRGYNLHQLQGNPAYGLNKAGYLLKKSVGKMHVKAWRKRRCVIKDGCLSIYHSDKTKSPTKLSLLTCQVKPLLGEDRKCFDLISFNRTYQFQVENEAEFTAWISVLINNKESALKREFNQGDVVDGPSCDENRQQNSLYIQQALINHIRSMPGNHKCVDCSTTTNDVTWLATNLGVLVCIECSGIHRDLGVQVSRIQSLTLDKIGTSNLLTARSMGNDLFNEVFEANKHSLDVQKLHAASSMDQRCQFIRAKYITRRFCFKVHDDEADQLTTLTKAIFERDLKNLLQLLGEGSDLASHLPNCSPQKYLNAENLIESYSPSELNDTSLHLAIFSQANQLANCNTESALHILDFIIQNSRTLNRQNNLGETALHYCVKYNQPESMKLLLRSGADITIKNSSGSTPLDLAQTLLPGSEYLIELIQQASQHKKALFDDVHSDWGLSFSTSTSTESSSEDSSDEEASAMDERPHGKSQVISDAIITRFRKGLKDCTDNPMSKKRRATCEVLSFQHQSIEKKKSHAGIFRSGPSEGSPKIRPNAPSPCKSPCDENANESPVSSLNRSHKTPSKIHTPTSYLRRAVNREGMQRVRQLLRVDNSKQQQ